MAVICGRPVEILSERTEYSQIFANMDGTRTLEQSVEPQRVRQGGGWVPVDTTLKRTADGVVPKAALLPMTFSNGGDTLVGRLVDGDREFALRWPNALPKPKLKGDTAIYPSVYPGVDLQVTASATGFSEVLVVRTRKAAASSKLASLKFGLETKGIEVRKNASGGLSAHDASGSEVFSTPAPLMWDSSKSIEESMTVPTAEDEAPRDLGPSGEDVQGARSRQAVIPISVGAESVTITPDKAMLSDPRTEFPVYIDPDVTGWLSGGAWTSVWSKYPTKSFWKNTTALTDGSITGSAGVGRTEDCVGCADHIIRSFFRLDMTRVKGEISSATFYIQQRWSWTCSPASYAKVWRMGSDISSATTWNNAPKKWGESAQSGSKANHKYGAVHGCDGVGDIEFNVKGLVSNADTTVTLGMKAIDESTKNQWKRYKPSTARLSVTYNAAPLPLANQQTHTSKKCATGSSRSYVTTTTDVTLSGYQDDPDPGDTHLTTYFYYWPISPPQTVSSVSQKSKKGLVTGTLPMLVDGATYAWNAKTIDRDPNDKLRMETWSQKTCEFTVDATRPPKPGPLSSPNYSATDPSGGVGYPGAFQIAAPVITGVSEAVALKQKQDIKEYAWSFDGGSQKDAPTVPVNVDFTGSIPSWTPRTDGIKTLYVWAKDRAGNFSAEAATYRFQVLNGSGPAADWDFDDAGNTITADDKAEHNNTLTLTGGTRVPGRGNVGSALSLNGTSARSATTSATVTYPNISAGTSVPVRTDASFTVTARVKLATTTGVTGQQVAVAASGNLTSAYTLGYDGPANKWRFTMAGSDAASPALRSANSVAAPTAGKWTHLTGVYDATTKKLTLYVNGVAQPSSEPLVGGFNTTGPVTIGKRKWNGADDGFFNGLLDDVQVYPTVATTEAIEKQAMPLKPVISFPDGAKVTANGTLRVTFDAGGDTNVTKFWYSTVSSSSGDPVNATTAGGTATVSIPAGSLRGPRQVYALAEDSVRKGPANQEQFVVIAPASLNGNVTYDGGKAVANAVVVMTPSIGGSSYTTQTDAYGFYDFPDVVPGNYIVRATVDGRCGSAGSQPKSVDETGPELRITLYRIKDEANYLCTVRTATFATGSAVLPLTGDDASTKVTLPFAFPFYGGAFQDLCVDTNGLIVFSTTCTSFPNIGNRQLGSTTDPNGGLIAPFWDDLVVDASANVRTAVSGAGATQQVLIEWNNVHRKGDTGQRLSFSVTLGVDGVVTTNYSGLDNAAEQGGNALVGTESPTGDVGFSYSAGDPVLANGTAVVFAEENAAPLEVHNLTGKVTNAAGAGVAGATVSLDPGGLTATTTADGSYAFYGLIADSYTVTSKQGSRCAAKAEAVVDLAADTVRNLQYGPDYGLMGYACTVGASGYAAADTNTWLTGDDAETTVYLPFSMPFYGRSHNYATVSTNGWIGIGGGYLTPLWGDLIIDDQAGVYTASRGTAPNRSFVIEWRNAQLGGSSDRTNFQAVLHEDGRIAYHYGAMSTDVQKGSTSTVGMVSMSFRTTAYYSDWEPALTANSSITYTPAASGVIAGVLTEAVSTEPIAGRTITLNPGGQTTTTGADGSYQFTNIAPGAYYVLASATDDRCLGQYATAEIYKTRGDAKADLTVNNDADPFYTCTETARPFTAADTVQTSWTGDDAAWKTTAPFPIKLYGESTTTPWISSNGLLTFGPEGATSPDHTAIPAPAEDGTPNTAAYPFWHDWVVDSSAAIATKTSGTAPNRQWIVEWRNVASYGNGEVRASFEIIFGEDGTVAYAYDGIDDNPIERGAEATVGVEGPGGAAGFQYLYSADLLHSGLGVTYTPKVTETGYVNGTITCAGQPVGGAVVSIAGQSLTTESDGGYFIGDIPAKTQTLLVTIPDGDCAGTVTRTVLIGEPMQPVDVTLHATAQGTGYTLTETDTAYTALGSDTTLAGADGYHTWTTVELPFAIHLYGQEHHSMSVGTEGTLDFANASLLPLRGDWEADSQSSVRTTVRGTAPNRQYVVEWRDVRLHTDTDTRVTFQAILDETGGFTYVYPGTDNSYIRSGGVSTIGLRAKDGLTALIYADRLPALRPGVALRIDPPTAA